MPEEKPAEPAPPAAGETKSEIQLARQERREKRQRRKREKLPQHGASLKRVYRDAVLKKAPPPDTSRQ